MKLTVDELIKKKFRLFSGVRSLVEDEKLFERISHLVSEEIGVFMSENLQDSDMSEFVDKLEQSKNVMETDKLWKKYADLVPDFGPRLESRIEDYLNSLKFNALHG